MIRSHFIVLSVFCNITLQSSNFLLLFDCNAP